jgi:hypothetical protein
MSVKSNDNVECCPKFDPSAWDEKSFKWDNKKFVKDTVSTLFYMPVNFGSVITKLTNKVQKAGANMPDWLCLSDHPSKWKMEILLAVDKNIPDAENVNLSGQYMSKVYEGDFKETKDWCKDFESYVKKTGSSIKKMYMWYTTCPKCAKKYGKNYVAIIAEVE